MFLSAGGKGIREYLADADGGGWRMTGESAAPRRVTALVRNSTAPVLYAPHAGSTAISAFAVARPGRLRLLNRVASGGFDPAAAVVAQDGSQLLVAHAGSRDVTMLGLAADGALRPVRQRLVLPARSRPSGITLDPSGRFAVLADAGLNGLVVLHIGADGWLSWRQFAGARPGARPDQVLFHPSLPVLYASNAGDATVSAWHWDCVAGRVGFAQVIRLAPPRFTGPNAARGMAISPDGRFLYALTGGHDSIAMLAIQRGKGKLFLRARTASGGDGACGLALHPAGTALAVAHRRSGTVTSFAVEPLNGQLTRRGAALPVPGVTSVLLKSCGM